ncbi:hypothetical protein [Shewanella waksmanii]|uniref:hypothetical protein n=1 Tax=Shewanella waksmanii TaxID=213783 RepID=UPI0037363A96
MPTSLSSASNSATLPRVKGDLLKRDNARAAEIRKMTNVKVGESVLTRRNSDSPLLRRDSPLRWPTQVDPMQSPLTSSQSSQDLVADYPLQGSLTSSLHLVADRMLDDDPTSPNRASGAVDLNDISLVVSGESAESGEFSEAQAEKQSRGKEHNAPRDPKSGGLTQGGVLPSDSTLVSAQRGKDLRDQAARELTRNAHTEVEVAYDKGGDAKSSARGPQSADGLNKGKLESGRAVSMMSLGADNSSVASFDSDIASLASLDCDDAADSQFGSHFDAEIDSGVTSPKRKLTSEETTEGISNSKKEKAPRESKSGGLTQGGVKPSDSTLVSAQSGKDLRDQVARELTRNAHIEVEVDVDNDDANSQFGSQFDARIDSDATSPKKKLTSEGASNSKKEKITAKRGSNRVDNKTKAKWHFGLATAVGLTGAALAPFTGGLSLLPTVFVVMFGNSAAVAAYGGSEFVLNGGAQTKTPEKQEDSSNGVSASTAEEPEETQQRLLNMGLIPMLEGKGAVFNNCFNTTNYSNCNNTIGKDNTTGKGRWFVFFEDSDDALEPSVNDDMPDFSDGNGTIGVKVPSKSELLQEIESLKTRLNNTEDEELIRLKKRLDENSKSIKNVVNVTFGSGKEGLAVLELSGDQEREKSSEVSQGDQVDMSVGITNDIEVNARNGSSQGRGAVKRTIDGGAQTGPSIDGGTQTESSIDGGAQTESGIDGGTQTESSIDGGTQTEVPSIDGGTQTESGIDGGAQTGPSIDGGTQTESGIDGGTQTESGIDGGTQTEVPSIDGGTQTEVPSIDGGTQTESGIDGGTQTESGIDGGTQTEVPSIDGGAQTEVPSIDGGTQTEAFNRVEVETQPKTIVDVSVRPRPTLKRDTKEIGREFKVEAKVSENGKHIQYYTPKDFLQPNKGMSLGSPRLIPEDLRGRDKRGSAEFKEWQEKDSKESWLALNNRPDIKKYYENKAAAKKVTRWSVPSPQSRVILTGGNGQGTNHERGVRRNVSLREADFKSLEANNDPSFKEVVQGTVRGGSKLFGRGIVAAPVVRESLAIKQ